MVINDINGYLKYRVLAIKMVIWSQKFDTFTNVSSYLEGQTLRGKMFSQAGMIPLARLPSFQWCHNDSIL